jgi:hypothetical protein
MSDKQDHWTQRAWKGLLLLLVIAIGARVVYGLLVPLVPMMVAGVVLLLVYALLLRRRH